MLPHAILPYGFDPPMLNLSLALVVSRAFHPILKKKVIQISHHVFSLFFFFNYYYCYKESKIGLLKCGPPVFGKGGWKQNEGSDVLCLAHLKHCEAENEFMLQNGNISGVWV